MAAIKIGDARCPLCGGTAHVSLSKSGLAVLTMNCCNAQLFTRSGDSDERVRALLLAPVNTAPAPGAPSPEPAMLAAPAPPALPPATPKPARTGWSLF